MMQGFKQLPGPLRKQILLRLGLCALFMALLAAALIMAQGPPLAFPCAGSMMFFAANAFLLSRRAALGEYLVVSGTCTEIGGTMLKRKAKYIVLDTGDKTVRVTLAQRRRRYAVGARLDLYLATDAPVYEKDGVLRVFSYLALEKNSAK